MALSFLRRKLSYLRLLMQLQSGIEPSSDFDEEDLTINLQANLKTMREVLGESVDIIFRRFQLFGQPHFPAALVFVEDMIDKKTINETVLPALMQELSEDELKGLKPGRALLDHIEQRRLTVHETKLVRNAGEAIHAVLAGDTVLLVEGADRALVFGSKGWKARQPEEPASEVLIRGPREGFVETLQINMSLIRRRIRNRDLVMERITLGKRTRTDVVIAYLKELTDPRLVEEVRRRLKRIQTDAILESGFVEEFIEDAPFSLFPTVFSSERPDVVSAKMLEGRVAILVDSTPFALVVPMLFLEAFHSPSDYYTRPWTGNLIRTIRYVAFLTSLLAPAVYVALVTFHQELIPTPLLLTTAAAVEGTPFPAVFEAILMGGVFEILREAGIRLPRAIGQALSIVGALVIGDAAVSAGLIGAPVVIMVAFTAISSFVVPVLVSPAAILRLVFTILAGAMGAFGIIVGLLWLLVHLCSLRSFGAPYLSPFAPLSKGDLKDAMLRAPFWAMFLRPRAVGWHDPQRQEFMLGPRPGAGKQENEQRSNQEDR